MLNVSLERGILRLVCTDEVSLRATVDDLKKVISKAEQTDFAERSPFHENVIVPPAAMGCVIGKKGLALQVLRERSGIM